MVILSTGPIDNNAVSGVRPTQTVTVTIVNRDADTTTVVIEGYYLESTRNMFVSETVELAPDEVVIRNYFADQDAFEFIFITDEIIETEVGISVWGKQADGQLVDAHRVVTHEKLD